MNVALSPVREWRDEAVLGAAGVMILAAALLHYHLLPQRDCQAFYLLPVAFATWFGGRAASSAAAALAPTTLVGMERVIHGIPLFHWSWSSFWDAGMKLGYFAAFAFLLAYVRRARGGRRGGSLCAEQLTGEMLSYVCHEFRNQIGTLNLGLRVLEAPGGGPQADGALRSSAREAMEKSLEILKRSASNLLNAARLQSGQFAVHPEVVDLTEIAGNSVASLGLLARQKEIDLRGSFPKEAVLVKGDSDVLALVISNLVGNAVKYTSEGGSILVRIISERGSALLCVEDTGAGIAPRSLDAILAGRYRASGTASSRRGFGVGLRVSGSLLKAQGSRLQASSDPGLGSRFYFRLPLAKKGSPPPPAVQQPRPARAR